MKTLRTRIAPSRTRWQMPLADPPPQGDEVLLRDRVRTQILEMIARHFTPRLPLPPMSQIARELSVSVGTVNQAMRELVNEGFLVSRQRMGTMLAPGCRIEDVQRGISRRRSSSSVTNALVRVVVQGDCDAMIREMADSFARTVTAAGARVEFTEFYRTPSGWVMDQDDNSDATAIFQPPMTGKSIRWDQPKPLVVAATDMRVIESDSCFDQISVDDEYGAYLAGRRFRETGHSNVCLVGRRDKTSPSRRYDTVAQRRFSGFERGWGERIPDHHCLMTGSYDLHHGAAAFADYMALSPRPQGVFCETDDLAIGFHIGAFAHRLRPGKDFSLIGFDKQQLGMDIPAGPLTTVEVPRQTMGERAAELLLDRLKNPRQPVRRISLGCTLFEGKTLIDHHKEHQP